MNGFDPQALAALKRPLVIMSNAVPAIFAVVASGPQVADILHAAGHIPQRERSGPGVTAFQLFPGARRVQERQALTDATSWSFFLNGRFFPQRTGVILAKLVLGSTLIDDGWAGNPATSRGQEDI